MAPASFAYIDPPSCHGVPITGTLGEYRTNRTTTARSNAMRYIVRLALLVSVFVALLATDRAHASADARVCLEDEPCWTWNTMGNGARGIVTVNGRDVVVSVCRFKRLDRAGRIDWSVTPRLKGDATARRAQC